MSADLAAFCDADLADLIKLSELAKEAGKKSGDPHLKLRIETVLSDLEPILCLAADWIGTSDERWKGSYDAWKTHNPEDDYWAEGEQEEGCTCKPNRRDKWCPVHGLDPDEERDKMMDRDR